MHTTSAKLSQTTNRIRGLLKQSKMWFTSKQKFTPLPRLLTHLFNRNYSYSRVLWILKFILVTSLTRIEINDFAFRHFFLPLSSLVVSLFAPPPNAAARERPTIQQQTTDTERQPTLFFACLLSVSIMRLQWFCWFHIFP